MNNTIQYKGYVGSVEFSEEDGIFYGKVMGIRSLISYEGESARELLDDFHDAVDDCLKICKAEGKEPDARLAAPCMGRTRSRRVLLFSVFDSAERLAVDEVLNLRHALTSDPAAPSR